jgi:urease accessory protein UreH
MNKESIIAISLGLLLGTIVATGVVYFTIYKQRDANQKMSRTAIKQATQEGSMSQSVIPPTVTVPHSLEIIEPSSGVLTQDRNVKIKGVAGKDVFLVVQSQISTQVMQVKDGNFTFDFALALGENAIAVTAYYPDTSVPVQKKLYIYRLAQNE